MKSNLRYGLAPVAFCLALMTSLTSSATPISSLVSGEYSVLGGTANPISAECGLHLETDSLNNRIYLTGVTEPKSKLHCTASSTLEFQCSSAVAIDCKQIGNTNNSVSFLPDRSLVFRRNYSIFPSESTKYAFVTASGPAQPLYFKGAWRAWNYRDKAEACDVTTEGALKYAWEQCASYYGDISRCRLDSRMIHNGPKQDDNGLYSCSVSRLVEFN